MEKIHNIQFINAVLANIFDVAVEIKTPKIIGMKFLQGNIGYTVELECDRNKKYYFGLSEYGVVEIVREDSEDGKIVFMPIDD